MTCCSKRSTAPAPFKAVPPERRGRAPTPAAGAQEEVTATVEAAQPKKRLEEQVPATPKSPPYVVWKRDLAARGELKGLVLKVPPQEVLDKSYDIYLKQAIDKEFASYDCHRYAVERVILDVTKAT